VKPNDEGYKQGIQKGPQPPPEKAPTPAKASGSLFVDAVQSTFPADASNPLFEGLPDAAANDPQTGKHKVGGGSE
jgi:hypothetical protein